MNELNLISLKNGEKAEIINLNAGLNLNQKLSSLNLRPGKIIKKIATHPLKGPIIISVDNTTISLGRGMAEQIFLKKIT
ncbi:ferrous iron transport protein A [Patescibacteria group bacterium]|nr:ferrous iron transport protein A [Patescibacteria group bacterium]